MKRLLIRTALMIAVAGPLAAIPSWGLHLTAGGRYDDVRMCVGSPAGVKGGPIMDVYVDLRIPLGSQSTLAFNLPVMRPILFGAAFGMLQFEPQISYEYRVPTDGSVHPVVGAGLGAVFHYGPDYTSDKNAPGPDFFAAGPLVSLFAGAVFDSRSGSWMPGIKMFYAPLFSPDYSTGTVFGGALELHYIFGH